MMRLLAVCALLALACQAGAVTSTYESFNGTYDGGPIGPKPAGWNYFGFGAPAYSAQETGIVVDGSAWRINVPGSAVTGAPSTIAIYKTGVSLDSMALAGQPIDWTKPVSLKADVYGADYGIGTQFQFKLQMQGYGRTDGVAEFGDNGLANGQWTTVTTPIDAGQAGKSGTLVLFLDFNFTNAQFAQTNAAIWDNLRLDYTPVPEPSSLLALLAGVPALAIFRRRK